MRTNTKIKTTKNDTLTQSLSQSITHLAYAHTLLHLVPS